MTTITVDLGDWVPSEAQLRYLATFGETNGFATPEEWRAYASHLFVLRGKLTPLGRAVLKHWRGE